MTDWQRDLEDARAIIEELTRERDEALGKTEHALCCLRGQQQATKEAHVAIERQRSRAVKAERGRDEARRLAKMWETRADEMLGEVERIDATRPPLHREIERLTIALQSLKAKVD